MGLEDLRDAAIAYYQTVDMVARWQTLGQVGRDYWEQPDLVYPADQTDRCPYGQPVMEVDCRLVEPEWAMVSVAVRSGDTVVGADGVACTLQWCSGFFLWAHTAGVWQPTEISAVFEDWEEWPIPPDSWQTATIRELWCADEFTGVWELDVDDTDGHDGTMPY